MDESSPTPVSRRKKIIAVIVAAVIVSAIFAWYYLEKNQPEDEDDNVFRMDTGGGARLYSWQKPDDSPPYTPNGGWEVDGEPKAGEPFYYTVWWERRDVGGDNLPGDTRMYLYQGPVDTNLTSIIITTSTGGYLECGDTNNSLEFGDNESLLFQWYLPDTFLVYWDFHSVRNVTYYITFEMVVDAPGAMIFNQPMIGGTICVNNTWLLQLDENGNETLVWQDEIFCVDFHESVCGSAGGTRVDIVE